MADRFHLAQNAGESLDQFLTRKHAALRQAARAVAPPPGASAGAEAETVASNAPAELAAELAEVWPRAAHQLCLFQETRRVTAAVQQVYRQVRASLSTPLHGRSGTGDGEVATTPAWRRALHGRPHKYIPVPDPTDPAVQRYQARQDARVLAIAQVQALHHSSRALRAIAKRTGLDRTTVRKYIREPAPDRAVAPAALNGEGMAAPSLTVAPRPRPGPLGRRCEQSRIDG